MSECCPLQQYSSTDNALIIVQGTTPILILDLEYDVSDGYDVLVAIKTGINKYFTIGMEGLTISKTDYGSQVLCQFTQEQTLLMNRAIWVQLRAKDTQTNNVLGTLEYEIKIIRIIDKEVM